MLDLEIDKTPDEDFQRQVLNLQTVQMQESMFQDPDLRPLELIPYNFRYNFVDDVGKRHKLKIVDWEIYQLYRNCRGKANWEDLVRQKYLTDLPKRNLFLFLGTMHRYPNNWIVIGVYYPTGLAEQSNMFDGQL